MRLEALLHISKLQRGELRGQQGDPGSQGDPGPPGDPGNQGDPGRDGIGPDEKVRVSEEDPTAGFLADKLTPGLNVQFRRRKVRGSERLVIDSLSSGGGVTVGVPSHPGKDAHNDIGLATQEELDAHAAGPHGGSHPDLATHDALGLATDAELAAHVGSGDPHPTYALDTDVTAHVGAADPHPGYLTPAEADAAYAPTHGHPYETSGTVAAHEAAGNPHPGYATDADLSDHAAAADPHAGYLQESAHTEAVHTAMAGLATQSELDAHGHTHGSLSGVSADQHHAQLHAAAHQPGGGDAIAVDAAAGTGSLRTLGAGATQAAAGNHGPHGDVAAHESAGNPHPTYLTQAEGDAAYQASDSDLTAIAALSTTAFGRSLLELADAAALAALHSHGGGAGSDPPEGSYAPGSFTVATGKFRLMSRRLILTGTQRATLQGTAALRVA